MGILARFLSRAHTIHACTPGRLERRASQCKVVFCRGLDFGFVLRTTSYLKLTMDFSLLFVPFSRGRKGQIKYFSGNVPEESPIGQPRSTGIFHLQILIYGASGVSLELVRRYADKVGDGVPCAAYVSTRKVCVFKHVP